VAAFDFTTKGILNEAVKNTEYWRLRDAEGKNPGLMGWWPSRAVTFIDNHDTGAVFSFPQPPSRHLTRPEYYSRCLSNGVGMGRGNRWGVGV